MKWMQRIYKAKNGVTEVTRFAVSDRARVRTGKDAGSPRKQEANKHQAVHRLARILNNNFQEHDLFLSLTYSESAFRRMRSEVYATLPKGRKEKKEVKRDAVLARAEQDGKDFIKLLRKLGADVSCYVSVPSDMDGDTGKEDRPHVHLIIKGESFALIRRKLTVCGQPLEELWGKGHPASAALRLREGHGARDPRRDGDHPGQGRSDPRASWRTGCGENPNRGRLRHAVRPLHRARRRSAGGLGAAEEAGEEEEA